MLHFSRDVIVEMASTMCHHQLSVVRLESLESAASILRIASSKCSPSTSSSSSSSSSGLAAAVRALLLHLFSQCLLEENLPVVEQLVRTWDAALETLRLRNASSPASSSSSLSCELLVELLATHVPHWMSLAMQPEQVPFDSAELSRFQETGAASSSASAPASAASRLVFIGGENTIGEAPLVRDAAVVRTRLYCARLVGALVAAVVRSVAFSDQKQFQQTVAQLVAVFEFHLSSRSAIQRLVSSLTLYYCLESDARFCAAEKGDQKPKPEDDSGGGLRWYRPLEQRMFNALQENIFFEEVIASFRALQQEARELLEHIARFVRLDPLLGALSVPLAPPSAMPLLTLDQIEKLVGAAFEQHVQPQLDRLQPAGAGPPARFAGLALRAQQTPLEQLAAKRANAREAVAALQQLQNVLQMRFLFLLLTTVLS